MDYRVARAWSPDVVGRFLPDGAVVLEQGEHRSPAHPFAWLAPPELTRDRAIDAWVEASTVYKSPATSAVIRCAMPDGFDVWLGVGGAMSQRPVRVGTYETAESVALRLLARERVRCGATVKRLLAGWEPETPFMGTTLALRRLIPWTLRRGPVTREEMGSSWDLPVVLELVDGERVRHDELVTWSDDESRARARKRGRDGMARSRRASSAP